jgi:hypothetical protein
LSRLSHWRMITVTALATIAGAAAANTLTPQQLESPAAAAIRNLPKEVVNAPKPKRFSLAAQREDAAAAGRATEEILVLGDRDPEDLLKKRPPMLAFRDRMDRERPMTPKEKTQLALCFIGLCGGNYGPDGAPIESKAFSRSELAGKRSTLEMTQQFRGTVQ